MKSFILPLVALLLALFTGAAAFAAGAKLSEERCFDIKESVLADLPHFCGASKTDQERLDDFGHQITMLEKSCNQPQLAHLMRKALAERVSNQNAKGCMAATEKAVLPPKAQAAAIASEDL